MGCILIFIVLGLINGNVYHAPQVMLLTTTINIPIYGSLSHVHRSQLSALNVRSKTSWKHHTYYGEKLNILKLRANWILLYLNRLQNGTGSIVYIIFQSDAVINSIIMPILDGCCDITFATAGFQYKRLSLKENVFSLFTDYPNHP